MHHFLNSLVRLRDYFLRDIIDYYDIENKDG